MLALDVSVQSTTPSRRVVAVLAWERALIGVNEDVAVQVLLRPKALPTSLVPADIWPLISVGAGVDSEVTTCHEPLAAVGADKGFLTRVSTLGVDLETTLLTTPIVAIREGARKGFQLPVDGGDVAGEVVLLLTPVSTVRIGTGMPSFPLATTTLLRLPSLGGCWPRSG